MNRHKLQSRGGVVRQTAPQPDCTMCTIDGCACSVNDLCCLQDPTCLPCELQLNAEVFGDVVVEGVAMLYFYKSRIHGAVTATMSDLVVCERTRFDSTVMISYYGTIIGSEFLNGIFLSSTALYDPCCISIALQGFFTTYIQGTLGASTAGTVFVFDITTNSLFAGDCGGGCENAVIEVLCNCVSACTPT